MKYPDGQEVRIGDEVSLWPGARGVVVCSIDTQEYSAEYPASAWSYLKEGVLIDSDAAGLIHYVTPEDSMRLLARAPRA